MCRVPQHFGYHIEVTQGFAFNVVTLLSLLAVQQPLKHSQSLHILGKAAVSEEGKSLDSLLLLSFPTGKKPVHTHFKRDEIRMWCCALEISLALWSKRLLWLSTRAELLIDVLSFSRGEMGTSLTQPRHSQLMFYCYNLT